MNRLKPDVTVPSGSQFVPRLVCVEVNKVVSKSAAPQNWTLTPDSGKRATCSTSLASLCVSSM